MSGGVGRYQSVGTHPNFRRRGVCGQLISYSSRYAFEKLQAKTLVMVAEPGAEAARVYESVGFSASEKAIGMFRYPKQEWKE